MEKNYGLDQNVNGKPLEQSLAELIAVSYTHLTLPTKA